MAETRQETDALSGVATGAAMGTAGGPVGAIIGGVAGAVTGRIISKGVEEVVGPDDPARVPGLREDFGLTRADLARLTGFSLRAVADWAGGEVPSAAAGRRLREVRRLLDALATVLRADGVARWLRAPNPAFEGRAPLEVVGEGEGDRLWAMVYELGSGEPL